VIGALFLLAACADIGGPVLLHGPDEGAEGRVSFALDSSASAAVKARIRLFQGMPASLAVDAYFESECINPSPGFAIDKVAVGSDYVMVYEAFSSDDCSVGTRVELGIRGGIDIQKGGSGEAFYFVQVNRVGAFTPMPVPGQELNPSGGGVSCQIDLECQELVECEPGQCGRFTRTVECEPEEGCQDGVRLMRYRVHPSAVCADGGTCRLDSLFPLNTRVRRAFHISASAADGDLAVLGGFNSAGAMTLQVVGASDTLAGPDSEIFNASNVLFGRLEPSLDLGSGLAFMADALLDERRMLLVGGAQSVQLTIDENQRVTPVLEPRYCNGVCDLTLSSLGWVLDIPSGAVTRSVLPFSTAAALAVAITGETGARVLIRPGLVQEGPAIVAGQESYVCDADDEGIRNCFKAGDSELAPPRFLASGVCLTERDGHCAEYLVLGGNRAGGAFAEVFSADDDTVRMVNSGAGVPETLFGAQVVRIGDRILAVGGGSQPRLADAAPIVFTFDRSTLTLTGRPASLAVDDLAGLLRRFHQITLLQDGQVLVTGGMDGNWQATSTATLLRVSGDSVEVTGRPGNMARARVGHRAVGIIGGLLGGSVLVTGGLENLTGLPAFAEGAELYVP
jgi:hypothetical protein